MFVFFITELSSRKNVLNILHIPSSPMFNANHFEKASLLSVECFITMPSTLFQSVFSMHFFILGASLGIAMTFNPVNLAIST